MVNFKIYDFKDWEANNYNTHIAQHLRNKDNQTMKFGQLIEYNARNIFLKKSYKKSGEGVRPRPFYKNSKLSIYLDQESRML